MNLVEKINKDYLTAFKAGDKLKKNLLSVIKGEIERLQVSDRDDKHVLGILAKMKKSLTQSIEYDENAKLELEIVNSYLPELMSEPEIREIVGSLIIAGNDNIGLIMREFNTKYKGKADNNMVKNIALEYLK